MTIYYYYTMAIYGVSILFFYVADVSDCLRIFEPACFFLHTPKQNFKRRPEPVCSLQDKTGGLDLQSTAARHSRSIPARQHEPVFTLYKTKRGPGPTINACAAFTLHPRTPAQNRFPSLPDKKGVWRPARVLTNPLQDPRRTLTSDFQDSNRT
jgi:hypothetical protein